LFFWGWESIGLLGCWVVGKFGEGGRTDGGERRFLDSLIRKRRERMKNKRKKTPYLSY